MVETAHFEATRIAFAKVTGALEDGAVAAAEGQAFSDHATPRRACDRLIVSLENCLRRLCRLRRSLG